MLAGAKSSCAGDPFPRRAADDFDFAKRLEELNEELETLNIEARALEERIALNVAALLERDVIANE